jgi:hypothetical protein
MQVEAVRWSRGAMGRVPRPPSRDLVLFANARFVGEPDFYCLVVECQCRFNFPHLCRSKIPQAAGNGDQPAV